MLHAWRLALPHPTTGQPLRDRESGPCGLRRSRGQAPPEGQPERRWGSGGRLVPERVTKRNGSRHRPMYPAEAHTPENRAGLASGRRHRDSRRLCEERLGLSALRTNDRDGGSRRGASRAARGARHRARRQGGHLPRRRCQPRAGATAARAGAAGDRGVRPRPPERRRRRRNCLSQSPGRWLASASSLAPVLRAAAQAPSRTTPAGRGAAPPRPTWTSSSPTLPVAGSFEERLRAFSCVLQSRSLPQIAVALEHVGESCRYSPEANLNEVGLDGRDRWL